MSAATDAVAAAESHALAGASAFDRKAQYQARRKALLHEAARQFMEGGEGKVSLTEIARRLNITKPALYHYFSSKQEILYECYALSFDIGDNALEAALATGGSAGEVLRAFVYHYTLAGLTELHATMALRDVPLEPEYSQRILARRDSLRRRLSDVVVTGQQDGSITPCNATFAVIVLIGGVTELLKVYDPKGEFTAQQIAEQAADQLVLGLAARAL